MADKTKGSDSRTVIEAGKDYLDTAVQAAKDHPAAAAGIAAGVVAVAAGAAYGAAALKARGGIAGITDEDLIIDPLNVPAEIPAGKPGE